MNINIYTLTDPRNDQVRYIGKTVKKLETRLQEHIKDAERSTRRHKNSQWLRGLIKNNLKPKIELLDVATEGSWEEEEKFYITYFRYLGFNLLNMTEGGDGCHGREMPESQREIFKKHKTPEIEEKRLANLRALLKGKPLPKDFVERMAQRAKGKKITPEQRERFLKSQKEFSLKLRKKIGQFDLQGNKINEYMGVKMAAEISEISYSAIQTALHRKKISHGFYWKHI